MENTIREIIEKYAHGEVNDAGAQITIIYKNDFVQLEKELIEFIEAVTGYNLNDYPG